MVLWRLLAALVMGVVFLGELRRRSGEDLTPPSPFQNRDLCPDGSPCRGAFYFSVFVSIKSNTLSPISTVSLASVPIRMGDHTLNSLGWERESND
jgi:hypothetical protein